MTKSATSNSALFDDGTPDRIRSEIVFASTMFYQAAEFAAAADAYVAIHGRHSMPYVTTFLLARSFELALKAGLLGASGATRKELHYQYGHDLEKLVCESERRGLMMVDSALPDTAWGIHKLNEAYRSKELEYHDRGAFSGPTLPLLRQLVHHALYRAALFGLRQNVRERLLKQVPPMPGFTLNMLEHYRTPSIDP